jgi:hypothetical protein
MRWPLDSDPRQCRPATVNDTGSTSRGGPPSRRPTPPRQPQPRRARRARRASRRTFPQPTSLRRRRSAGRDHRRVRPGRPSTASRHATSRSGGDTPTPPWRSLSSLARSLADIPSRVGPHGESPLRESPGAAGISRWRQTLTRDQVEAAREGPERTAGWRRSQPVIWQLGNRAHGRTCRRGHDPAAQEDLPHVGYEAGPVRRELSVAVARCGFQGALLSQKTPKQRDQHQDDGTDGADPVSPHQAASREGEQ